MYYSLFGRYHYPGTRTCNCFPQKFKQQNNNIGQCNPPVQSNCPKQLTDKFCKDSLYIKSSAFGGFILPEGTEKGATLHAVSYTHLDVYKRQASYFSSASFKKAIFLFMRPPRSASSNCPASVFPLYHGSASKYSIRSAL